MTLVARKSLSVPVVVLAVLLAAPLAFPCTDVDGDGYFVETACGPLQDCNDASLSTYPGAQESCDGADNDCNGLIDDLLSCDTTCDAPETDAPDRIVSGTCREHQDLLGAAWNGTVLAVTWVDERDGNDEIYFARYDASGDKIGSDVRLSDTPDLSLLSSIVWNGSEYAVVWREGPSGSSQIVFRRLDANGVPLGDPVTISSNGNVPQIAWSGREYFVVFHDPPQFVRVSREGVPLGAPALLPFLPGGVIYTLVWNGSSYALAWEDATDVWFGRLDESGAALAPATQITNAVYSGKPRLCWTGSNYGLIWRWDTGSSRTLYFTRLDPSGARIGGDLTLGDTVNEFASIVWSGGEYAVAWGDSTGRSRLTRIDGGGNRLVPDVPVPQASVLAPRVVARTPGYAVLGTNFMTCFLGRVICNCFDADHDGYTVCAGDCNEADPSIHPGATEICKDGIDQDCNGQDLTKCPKGRAPKPENCRNGIDDDFDNLTDCQDPDCSGSNACPALAILPPDGPEVTLE